MSSPIHACIDCGAAIWRPSGRCRPCHLAHERSLETERFWAKVDRSAVDGCWLWTGAPGTTGYGNASRSVDRPHRRSYELNVGPIRAGMFVCHRCDVRLCVRPDHLFLGTHEDNQRDKIAKGRQEHGDGHHMARAPFLVVLQARELRSTGASYTAIAERLRVSRWTVRNWVNGHTRLAAA